MTYFQQELSALTDLMLIAVYAITVTVYAITQALYSVLCLGC